jgi:gluconolactonase
MRRKRVCWTLTLVLLGAVPTSVLAQADNSKVLKPAEPRPAPATIEGIGPVSKITKLNTKVRFRYTGGPAADAQGNIYFTDIADQKIYKFNTAGKLTLFRENTNHANGLAFSPRGDLVACEMDGRVVAFLRSGKLVGLTNQYDGKRFNAPNDLVIDRRGGIYFTDPDLRAPKPLPQGKTAVYYIAPDLRVTRLIDTLPNPKGLCLSPDEKKLYVVLASSPQVVAYPVVAPGKLMSGRVFGTLQQTSGKNVVRGGDGATVDCMGNLYVATGLGVQVFDPQGKHLGTIAFPERPSNLTFGGPDFKTLYVTASHSLYAAPMELAGARGAVSAKVTTEQTGAQ